METAGQGIPIEASPERASWIKRVALATLMAVVGMNVWIGGPLLALWIGARLQTASGGSLTIRPATALVIFVSLVAITFALTRLLKIVATAYDRAVGVGPAKRRHDSWIADDGNARKTLTALERILVVVVTCAAVAFEIWFFFFSTSPIDGRSGRSAIPLARVEAPAPHPGAGTAARSPALRADQPGLLRSAR